MDRKEFDAAVAALDADVEGASSTDNQDQAQGSQQTPPETPPPAASATPPAEPPKAFKAKFKGQEREVPLYDQEGNVNPLVIERFQLGELGYRSAEEAAEARKELAKVKADLEAQITAAKAVAEKKQEADPFGDLPEEDPTVKVLKEQHNAIKTLMQELNSIKTDYTTFRKNAEEREQQAYMRQQQQELERITKGIKDTHKNFDDRDIEVVQQLWMKRVLTNGETELTMEKVADEYAKWVDGKVQSEIERFKSKTKTTTPPKAASVPPLGTPPKPLNMDKGEVAKHIIARLEAAEGG